MIKIRRSVTYVKNNYFYFLLTLIVIGLSILRQPMFFIAPRIWAEEASVYIASILSNGLLHSLIAPHLGYYSLFPNFVIAFGLILFGFNGVAYITTLFSFLIVLMTVFSPLILRSKYWDTKLKIFSIVIFALILGPNEIWLNTITSQFYFCLFSCLLLLSDISSIRGWRLYYVIFMLIIGVLNGITTIVLFPFYLLNFIKDRKNKLNYTLLIILFFGACVQFYSLIYFINHPDINRFDISNINHFPSAFWRTLTSIINQGQLSGRIYIFLATFLVLYSVRSSIKKYLKPIMIAFYLSILFAFLSIDMNGGSRYGYPVAVLVCIFIINALSINNKIIKLFLQFLIALIFLVNLQSFFKIKNAYNASWTRFSTKDIVINSDGKKYMRAFPQPVGNWTVYVTDSDLERYK